MMGERYTEKNKTPGDEIDLLKMILVIWKRKWCASINFNINE